MLQEENENLLGKVHVSAVLFLCFICIKPCISACVYTEVAIFFVQLRGAEMSYDEAEARVKELEKQVMPLLCQIV